MGVEWIIFFFFCAGEEEAKLNPIFKNTNTWPWCTTLCFHVRNFCFYLLSFYLIASPWFAMLKCFIEAYGRERVKEMRSKRMSPKREPLLLWFLVSLLFLLLFFRVGFVFWLFFQHTEGLVFLINLFLF